MAQVQGPLYAKFNYGFSKINLEFGSYTLYTCKILVSYGTFCPSFENNNIRVVTAAVTKKGITTAMKLITYATMDYAEHRSMQKEIGKYLHSHAKAKLDSKYAYAYDAVDETYADMELIFPTELV